MKTKPTVTGLMDMEHEVKRLESLFHKKVGSAYYLPDYGLDWDTFQADNMDIPVGALLSHLTQKAYAQGIVILDQEYSLEDFSLKIVNQLLSEQAALSRGI